MLMELLIGAVFSAEMRQDDSLELLRRMGEIGKIVCLVSAWHRMHDISREEGPVVHGTGTKGKSLRARVRTQKHECRIAVRYAAECLEICIECVAEQVHRRHQSFIRNCRAASEVKQSLGWRMP